MTESEYLFSQYTGTCVLSFDEPFCEVPKAHRRLQSQDGYVTTQRPPDGIEVHCDART
jgi:hypothetical protein